MGLCLVGKYDMKGCYVESGLSIGFLQLFATIVACFTIISFLLLIKDYRTSHKK